MPSPPKFILRLLLASALVLGLAYGFQRTVAEWLVPVMRVSMMASQQEFRILSVDLSSEGVNPVMQVRANLAAPLWVEGRAAYPIHGWLRVTLTLGGLVGYGLLALIVVLAWPAMHAKELLARLIIVLPMIMLLTVTNAVSTWSAELWAPILEEIDPHRLWPSMMWSRFLMGGGGYVCGLLCGVLAISLASQCLRPKRHAESRYASFVVTAKSSAAAPGKFLSRDAASQGDAAEGFASL